MYWMQERDQNLTCTQLHYAKPIYKKSPPARGEEKKPQTPPETLNPSTTGPNGLNTTFFYVQYPWPCLYFKSHAQQLLFKLCFSKTVTSFLQKIKIIRTQYGNGDGNWERHWGAE